MVTVWATHFYLQFDICLGLPPDRTWPEETTKNSSGDERRSGSNRDSKLAGLCWSSVHLDQCEPDEPSWSWSHTWVQTRMPDYSLYLNQRVRCNTIIFNIITQPKPGAIQSRICPSVWLKVEVDISSGPKPGRRVQNFICKSVTLDGNEKKNPIFDVEQIINSKGLTLYIYIYIYSFRNSHAQSAGVVKYTDCFSVTKQSDGEVLGEWGVHLHWHRSQVHSGSEW